MPKIKITDIPFYERDDILDKAIKALGGPTAEKAAEMLRHGSVRGKSLTTKQKGYFGMVASRNKKQGGGSLTYSGKPDPFIGPMVKGSEILKARELSYPINDINYNLERTLFTMGKDSSVYYQNPEDQYGAWINAPQDLSDKYMQRLDTLVARENRELRLPNIKKHGGNIDMAKYHNLSDEEYDKMVKSVGSMMMRFGGNLEALRRKPGGSNVGKARKTSGPNEGPFVGPSGGAPKGSYPVTNRKQWAAAKAYARHAPNPGGIRAAADRIARKRGWLAYGGPTPSMETTPAQYALGLGQMIGPGYDWAMAMKKAEEVNYPRIQAALISLKAGVKRAIDALHRRRNVALNTIRETATSAQQYLQNARAVDSDTAKEEAAIILESQEKEANLNAAIQNQVNVGNVNIAIQEEIARSQGKAARQEAGARGAYGMGEALGGIGQDVAGQKMNKQWLDIYEADRATYRMQEKQPEIDYAAREAEYRTTPYALPEPKVFTETPTPYNPDYFEFNPYIDQLYPRRKPMEGAPYAF